MSLALVRSRALSGLSAPPVTVEAHLANGLPSFTLVGLADVEVKEARERVRSALQNAGLDFPSNKRITINLAPADLPKDSGRFDLPIALGILAAAGQLDAQRLADYEFAGELSLSGELRPVRGALAMSLAAHAASSAPAFTSASALASTSASSGDGAGVDRPLRLVLPPGSAEEAALVPGAQVIRARHLLDVVARFAPGSGHGVGDGDSPHDTTGDGWTVLRTTGCAPRATPAPDLRDVKGHAAPKRALEIAAAGAHSALLVGPPGSGKSLLAQRFAGLLPPMQPDEALQSAALLSLVGLFDVNAWGERPTRAPHHTASAVALVGGGSPPRPGEVSLAHAGVLFLDEFPEFTRHALEALREPLESGHICVSRAAQRVDYPARFQLLAAMNPCPCGYLGSAVRTCRCTPDQIARYQGRISGPLLDRIDLQVEVVSIPPDELLTAPPGEPSQAIQARCADARARAMARQGVPNQALSGGALDEHAQADDAARQLLTNAAQRLGWSSRGMHRALRVARTIADLADSPTVQAAHVAEAIQYRRVLRIGV